MPLMGSLYIGNTGLQSSQNALNTTAHNLSNVETPGYTRQQVEFGTKRYNTLAVAPKAVSNQQTGLGVVYNRVKQIRDYFLDRTYRTEVGRADFYKVSYEAVGEVENLLGELDQESFQTAISDMWVALQELSKDPASSITQGTFVHRSAELISRAQEVYGGLAAYQDNVNDQIKQKVDLINAYGQELLLLNDQVRAIETGGVEKANDLRDRRNYILDELAALCNMSYGEDIGGNVWVRIEGEDFVRGESHYEISTIVDPSTNFYLVYWKHNARMDGLTDPQKIEMAKTARVFNLKREVSSDYNTDIGGLKAMLLARGEKRADYTDLGTGSYGDISQSVIMNVQAEFDNLIHKISTKVNEILTGAGGMQQGPLTVTWPNGTVEALADARYAYAQPGGYLRDAQGLPIQMFTKRTTPAYKQATDAGGNTVWVWMPEDASSTDTLYRTSNLQVNKELLQKPAMLRFRLDDNSEDVATMEALKAAFQEEAYSLNPNVLKKANFGNYYQDLVSQLANTGSVFNHIYQNQLKTSQHTYESREQLLGVSSDEELSHMIRFQNGFNASSRYINVIDQMLEHLVNKL